jgi:hypothetical protein
VVRSGEHHSQVPSRPAPRRGVEFVDSTTPVNVKSEPARRESEAAADDDERNSTLYCWPLRTFIAPLRRYRVMNRVMRYGVIGLWERPRYGVMALWPCVGGPAQLRYCVMAL